jgi:hypothetical protein
MLGVHLVDHGTRQGARRLPGHHRLDHVGDRFKDAGEVVGGHPHRPPLGLGPLVQSASLSFSNVAMAS